jgi:hypothetical protein
MFRAADVIRYTTIRNFFNRVAQDAGESSDMYPSRVGHHYSRLWRQSTLAKLILRSTPPNTSDRRYFALHSVSSSAHDNRSDPVPPKNPSVTSSQSSQDLEQGNQHNLREESSNNDVREKYEKDPTGPVNPHLQNYSALFRQLALSLPHVKQPTKQDFLQAATSMWQRMRIRFKWFAIKSFRKFNADDISAFLSWFLVGQTLWILVGT